MDIIFFIYGLSFFVLGILVLFVRTKDSTLFFAKKIWLLGMFAISHAIVEWMSLYTMIYPQTASSLLPFKIIFLLISYLFLFEFSRFILRKSFENQYSKYHFIHNIYSAPIIYIITASLLIVYIIMYPGINEMSVAIRYTYGFWGSFFLGIGLYFYSNSLKNIENIKELKFYFKISGISFLAYSFFAGLVVPPVAHFPANYLNEVWFIETFHLPVQVFRTICAIAIAISSIKALEIFSNELLTKLNISFNKIKEFNSNASHQLKTPLASMKVQIDVTLQKDRETSEYKTVLESVNDEIISLQKMITNLLLLTRIKDSSIKASFKDVEIDAILLEVIGTYMVIANNKKISLNIKNLDAVTIKGNETLLSIMITNLIDNAIKYTKEGKSVIVDLSNNKLTIMDEGIGISKDKIDFIFNKFFQVDSSKGNNLGGFGLGLSMVEKIADLHKASIFVDSEENKGTSFTIKFN
ncbi:MAG: two-component system phosphate regulon sensor histidine kinase PhoR [Sulfurimonas sp.]|jgi:two-component system phosphate regulon sensor histidine kinase PhoR